MPTFLTQHIAPNGKPLIEQKGIIYVPNTSKTADYSKVLRGVLDTADIHSFEINSDNKDALEHLHAYKNYNDSLYPRKILICKGMAKVGFSDNGETNWIIYLQPGDATQFCQSAGRAMRLSQQDPDKVAYIMAFNDVKSTLVFQPAAMADQQADEAALARCVPGYLTRRRETQGTITIPFGGESLYSLEAEVTKDEFGYRFSEAAFSLPSQEEAPIDDPDNVLSRTELSQASGNDDDRHAQSALSQWSLFSHHPASSKRRQGLVELSAGENASDSEWDEETVSNDPEPAVKRKRFTPEYIRSVLLNSSLSGSDAFSWRPFGSNLSPDEMTEIMSIRRAMRRGVPDEHVYPKNTN